MPRTIRAKNDQVQDQTAIKITSVTLTSRETRVKFNTTGATICRLPLVNEMEGLHVTVILDTDGGTLTIKDQGDSYNWSDCMCTASGNGFLFYSDGECWWIVGSVNEPQA